jgi:hypothetical protein
MKSKDGATSVLIYLQYIRVQELISLRKKLSRAPDLKVSLINLFILLRFTEDLTFLLGTLNKT